MNTPTDLPVAFWTKVEYAGTHWLWIGAHQTHGYGSFSQNGRTALAHRLAYTDANGPIADELTIDHLCRIHACINPAHLEADTVAVNSRRGKELITHCPRGHEYTPENTRLRGNKRDCRKCHNEHRRENRQSAKASA